MRQGVSEAYHQLAGTNARPPPTKRVPRPRPPPDTSRERSPSRTARDRRVDQPVAALASAAAYACYSQISAGNPYDNAQAESFMKTLSTRRSTCVPIARWTTFSTTSRPTWSILTTNSGSTPRSATAHPWHLKRGTPNALRVKSTAPNCSLAGVTPLHTSVQSSIGTDRRAGRGLDQQPRGLCASGQ
jgi:hypothetical protein